jgi:hypothetical protein
VNNQIAAVFMEWSSVPIQTWSWSILVQASSALGDGKKNIINTDKEQECHHPT